MGVGAGGNAWRVESSAGVGVRAWFVMPTDTRAGLLDSDPRVDVGGALVACTTGWGTEVVGCTFLTCDPVLVTVNKDVEGVPVVFGLMTCDWFALITVVSFGRFPSLVFLGFLPFFGGSVTVGTTFCCVLLGVTGGEEIKVGAVEGAVVVALKSAPKLTVLDSFGVGSSCVAPPGADSRSFICSGRCVLFWVGSTPSCAKPD